MSAYLCSPTHIAVLAARLFPNDPDKAVRAAKILAKENVKSIMYRYNDCDTPDKACQAFLRMDYEAYITHIVTLAKNRKYLHPSALALPVPRVLGLIHCLNYQSCEHDEWPDSTAKRLLNKLVKQLGATWETESEGWSLDPDELSVPA